MNSLHAVQLQLEAIVNKVQYQSDDDQVMIKRSGYALQVISQSLIFPPWVSATRDTETIAYFKTVFGEKRVLRLLKRPSCTSYCVKRHFIEKLFVHIGEVFYSDLSDLFDEIKGNGPTIRFLNEKESADLRVRMRDVKELPMCSKEALDILMKLLVPFAKIDELFLNNPPNNRALSLDSGKEFESVRRRVYTYETMRRNLPTEPLWMMNLAKILADREMPEGTMIRGAQGSYCKVHAVVHQGGAFKYFLKTIGREAASEGNYILARGTRPHPRSTDWYKTLCEDFCLTIGARGPKATFEATKKLLSDPQMGFIEKGDEKITLIGYSLGGAQSQIDMLLHGMYRKIDRLVTIASPGTNTKIAELFAERVNQGLLGHPVIEHFFEAVDPMSQFGQVHLGFKCDPKKAEIKVHFLENGLKVVSKSPFLIRDELVRIAKLRKVFLDSFWKQFLPGPIYNLINLERALFALITAIFTVHTKNTLLSPHSHIFSLLNQKEGQSELVQEILSHLPPLFDPRWEKLHKSYSFFPANL